MHMDILSMICNIIISAGAGAGITFLLRIYFNEKIKNSIQYEYNIKTESYKAELRREIDKDLELYKKELNERESKNSDKWKIKREACLNALNLADSALSNMNWAALENINDIIIKSKIDTIAAREC